MTFEPRAFTASRLHPFPFGAPAHFIHNKEETFMTLNKRALLVTVTAAAVMSAFPLSALAQKKIVLGFSQVGAESEWRTANTESIKSAAKDAGIDLKFSDAQQKQENQIKAIRSFIAQKVDVIAFSPVVESGWETVLMEAKAAKIPVVLTDRSVSAKDTSLYVTFMGSDFTEEGRKAGRWLIEKMKGTTGDVNIVELQGTVGSAPAIDRKKGFEEVIKADPRFKIIRSQTGDFTRAKGKEVMEAFLKAEGKKINVLYAHNDDMAIGAIQAIEEAGLKPAKDITIISIDAVKGAFEAMMAGKLNVSVECSPLLGPQLMSATKDIMAGKPVPKRIVTDEGIFPMEVAAKEFPKRKY
jgi:simple sugar transport system substrate-binding protein